MIPDDLELETHEYLKYGAITIVTLFIVKIINMGLILRNAEQLRKERPVYSTPVIPPIRNVNSSVKLPTFPPSTPITPLHLLTPTDPLAARSLSTIDETATTSTESSVELVTLTPSRSAPELTSLEPPSPSNLSPSTPSPSNFSPSPEIFYRNSSSTDDHTHSNHSRSSPESNTSVSLPTLDSPDGIENEPPLENVRNLNSNENVREGEGLRKRTAVSFADQ